MNSLTQFVRAWYAFEFLRELVLIYPVYAIMIGEAGVSPFGLSMLLVAWSSTAIALEVPSGIVADRISRPLLIAAGLVTKAAAFFIWWLVPSFTGFLSGFVLWGIGSSLRSGTAESLLHDKLVELGHSDLFEHVYGRGVAASSTGALIATALGGWAASGGFSRVLWLSALAPLSAATLVLLSIREAPRTGSSRTYEGPLGTLAAGVSEVRRSKKLRLPFLFLCSSVVAYEAGEEYFGPLLREFDLRLTTVGIAIATLLLAHIVGSSVAARLRNRPFSFSSIFAAAGLSLVLASWLRGVSALPALWLFVALIAVGKVLLQGRLQRAIASSARATITSAVGMAQELVSVAVFLAIGAIASNSSWRIAFAWLAIGLLASVLLLNPLERRARR